MNRRVRAVTVAVLVAGSLIVPPARTDAQEAGEKGPPPALLLILDSSGSMKADDGSGRSKIAAAKDALHDLVAALPDDVLVGLGVYGHRIPNTDKRRGCKDTELIVPVRPLDKATMNSKIESFEAKGFTPIGLGLLEAAEDLKAQEGKRTIVLVSDGIDTCAPPPPCEIAKRITSKGIDLRIDTVGFQVDAQARDELRCIARVAGGEYFDAGSSEELSGRLQQLSVRALRTYETVGLPIEGTSTPDTAPLVESGQYTDSIRREKPSTTRSRLPPASRSNRPPQ